MHVTALVKSREHVCCRYRMAAFRPILERGGHGVSIRPWSRAWFFQRMIGTLFPGGAGERALIVQRRLLPDWQLAVLRRGVRWLIYDFDDAIFLHSSYNPRGHCCPKRFARFRAMVQAADAVIAGNGFLRNQAAGLTDAGKVHLIPTCIDASRYRLARHASTPSARLAWIGSSSTIRGLEKIRGLLERMGRHVPGIKLKVICDRSLQLDGLPVEFRRWHEASEAAELADAEIGLSWLPDDGWSAGKCGLKVLQYMAAGLPVVCNPVGVQATMVRHGETGLHARTPQEWEDAVRVLAGDAELRRRLGGAGRRLVETEYGVARGGEDWLGVLRSLADAGRALHSLPHSRLQEPHAARGGES